VIGPGFRTDIDVTKDQIKAVLDRVLTWPPERQEDVAAFLMSVEAQDKSRYRLSDEQLAQLRQRRAELNPKTLTLAEFDERLRRFGF
jgi:DNA-binding transcriptional MerR regulator